LLQEEIVMPINWGDFMPQGWVAVGAAGGILVTLVGGTVGVYSAGYSYGKDVNQAHLEQCKAATEANLPQVTTKLLAVDKDLRESLDIFGQNKTLKAENTSYQQQLAEAAKTRADLEVTVKGLQGDLWTAAEREKNLRTQIERYLGDRRQFKIDQNKSEFLGEGHVVGVSRSSGTSKLVVVLDNTEHTMSSGSFIPVDLSTKRCILTLLSLDYAPTKGEFDWSCKDKEDTDRGNPSR
jgi:hypothetical protein